MSDADQGRYKSLLNVKDMESPVKLDCAACHVTDSGDFQLQQSRLGVVPEALLLPKRTPGEYMLPISYENQCRACHPTTFERADENDPHSGKPILHGLQPKEVREWLE